MHETPLESQSMPHLETIPKTKEVVASPDTGDTFPKLFEDIDAIEGQGTEPTAPDFGLAKIGERIGAGTEDVRIADAQVHFTERSQALEKKKQGIKEVFEEKVSRALLPVMTALAFNTAPAFAQESQTDRPVVNPENPSLVVKSESRELKTEEVFDVHSPLAIVGEKMKQMKREMTPGELSVLQDLHKKTWEGKNEWATLSGNNEQGEFLVEIKESGPLGGTDAFNIGEKIQKNSSLMHTHPVEAANVLGYSSEAIRKGEAKPFIMPPSVVDIGQCMDDALTDKIQRVVDPRGVWEYRCDPNHPMVQMRSKLIESVSTSMGKLKDKYAVLEEDFTRMSATLENNHPQLMGTAFFSELDKKYPGIKEDNQAMMVELGKKNQKSAQYFLEFETEGQALLNFSTGLSEKDLTGKLQTFIQKLEGKGVYVSYTPFKDFLKKE